MTTIAETYNSESNLWNDYSAAEEAVNNEYILNHIAFFSLAASAASSISSILLYSQAWAPIAVVCSIVFPIFIALGLTALRLRDKMHDVPYYNVLPLGISTATTIFSKDSPLVRFGLPIFGIMAQYSSYLQTKGLTKERFLELSIGKLKDIIASDEPKKECVLIDKILKQGDYTYIYVNSEKLSPIDRQKLSPPDMQQLLLLGYQHKKILCFSSLVHPTPTKPQIQITYDQNGTNPVYLYVPTKPDEIWLDIALNSLDNGYDEGTLEAFKFSTDYLIQCKKDNPHLDDEFINAQLTCLSQTWGSKNSAAIRLKSNLSLKNGHPLITTRLGELGNIKEIKKELLENFDSIELVREDFDAWKDFF